MATNIRNMIINLENAVHQKEAQIRQLKNEIKEEFKGEIERLNTRIDLLKDVVDKYIIFVMD